MLKKEKIVRILSQLGLVVVMLCGVSSALVAQETTIVPEVKVIAKAHDNKILLRWGVTTPSGWLKANTYGYSIERYTIARGGVLLPTPERQLLTPTPMLPKPLEAWEGIVDRDDYAAILAQALYGDTFEVEGMQEAGAIAQIVNKSKAIEQRFSFGLFAADMSFEAAKMAALGYEDNTIQPGEEYLYKVTTAIPEELLKVGPGTVVIKSTKTKALPAPIDLIAVPDDKIVILTWDYEMFSSLYTTYFVEKSENGTDFIRLGDKPVVNFNGASKSAAKRMRYVDTLSQNDKSYYYRVKGISPFGEESPPSEIIEARGIKKLKAHPQIINHTLESSGGVILEWEFLKEAEKQIKGFELNWAPKQDGPYKVVKSDLPPSSRKTSYDALSASNYFTITAIGKNEQKSKSLATFVQTVDSIPPAAPVGIVGVIDTLGIVTLQWQANAENDMLGYRVFRGNLEKEEVSQITTAPVQKNAFNDTVQINSLNREVFYQVVAVDKRHNMSDYSEKVKLAKPDVVAPSSPIFLDYKTRKDGVFLKWINSTSEDIDTHQLYRQNTATPEKGWVLLFKTDTVTSFVDKKVQPKLKYRYAIFAQDKNKLMSEPSTPITVVTQNSVLQENLIKGFTAVADRNANKIILNWRKMPEEVVEILIYKSKKEEKPVLWRQLSGTIYAVEDQSVSPNNIYVYQIKAMTANGSHSNLITKEITY